MRMVQEGMVPIEGSAIQDGVYSIAVDSSSSMFKITACELTVEGGQMTAVMHMGGKGYLKLFMGTGEEAVAANEDDCIPFEENAEGSIPSLSLWRPWTRGSPAPHSARARRCGMTGRWCSVPIRCQWTRSRRALTPKWESLSLADGSYTVSVQLEGGSGKASVASPAALRVENGVAYATIIWSSSNYDYMKVDGEKYDPLNAEGNATFEIPCFRL